MEDIYNCSYEESDRTIASVANLVNGSTNTSATCNGTVLEDAPMLTSTALIKAVVLAQAAQLAKYLCEDNKYCNTSTRDMIQGSTTKEIKRGIENIPAHWGV